MKKYILIVRYREREVVTNEPIGARLCYVIVCYTMAEALTRVRKLPKSWALSSFTVDVVDED